MTSASVIDSAVELPPSEPEPAPAGYGSDAEEEEEPVPPARSGDEAAPGAAAEAPPGAAGMASADPRRIAHSPLMASLA
eukprot:7741319-Alexandrium_andersonii.AAC.1